MHPTGACIRIAARVIRDRRNIGHIYLSVRASDRFTRARCARVLQLVITAWIGRTPHEKQRGRRGEEWRSIRKLSRPAEEWGGDRRGVPVSTRKRRSRREEMSRSRGKSAARNPRFSPNVRAILYSNGFVLYIDLF